MIPLVGFTGKAEVGKDTAANFLVNNHRFIRYGFADPVKTLLNQRFGWTSKDWENRVWKETPSVIVGNPAKEDLRYLSPRQLAQWLGTEVGRHTFGADCWVKIFHRWYDEQLDATSGIFRVVISDVRFENEAKIIRLLGGIIIHLRRDAASPVAAHISETGIEANPYDYLIYNNSSLDELYKNLEVYLRK